MGNSASQLAWNDDLYSDPGIPRHGNSAGDHQAGKPISRLTTTVFPLLFPLSPDTCFPMPVSWWAVRCVGGRERFDPLRSKLAESCFSGKFFFAIFASLRLCERFSSSLMLPHYQLFYTTDLPCFSPVCLPESLAVVSSSIRQVSAGDRGQGTGDRGQGTGNREQGTGNREQGTGNRELGTGNREQGTGKRGQRTGGEPECPNPES